MSKKIIQQNWVMATLKSCEGFRTTPVFADGSAKPFAKGQDYKSVADYKDAVSIGLVLDNHILVDYDGNKGDVMPVDELAEHVGEEFGMPHPAQVNEKGDSIHWLYRYDGDAEGLSQSTDGWFEHIDIKRGNQLMHLKEGKILTLPNGEIENAPSDLIAGFKKVGKVLVRDGVDDELESWGGVSETYEKKSREEIQSMLDALDNGMGNAEWVKVGRALWDWDKVEGLGLWEAWSQGAENYEAGACERRWSFEGSQVTVATLFYMAKQAGWVDNVNLAKIEACLTTQDLRAAADEIKAANVDRPTLLELAAAFKRKFKLITGAIMPIGDARNMMQGEFTLVNTPVPDWCLDWIYLNSHGKFVDLRTLDYYNIFGFNLKCSVNVDGIAANFVADSGFIKTIQTQAYLPFEDDKIVMVNGRQVLNIYDHSSAPEAGERDANVEKIIINHLKGMLADEAEAFIHWLAWQVQHTGIILRWCPILIGEEGTGKSFFGRLLQAALGRANVGTVEPGTVNSSFNGWAEGKAVNILQELKMVGHNRFDVANKMKPLITDTEIGIERKGIDSYSTLNTCNYLAFTNYNDAVPLTDKDRRWWAVEAVKVPDTTDEYFDALFGTLASPEAIRGWLKAVKIPSGFGDKGAAPDTSFKSELVATEEDTHDGLDDVKEALNSGEYGLTKKVFIGSAMDDYLPFGVNGDLTRAAKIRLYKQLRFRKRPNRVKINGKAEVVWVSKNLTTDEIRAIIGTR